MSTLYEIFLYEPEAKVENGQTVENDYQFNMYRIRNANGTIVSVGTFVRLVSNLHKQPAENEYVLMFDQEIKRYRIVKRVESNGMSYWVTDARLFLRFDDQRYCFWMPMPKSPTHLI